ncbi:MAG: sulfoxide reductase heme-binding subunit YedZ, partial [Rhodospirillaceae bacterium]|jgi:methionine sulfoxide reductase heme-binding subunit|nr:sulfoxide reductase heme-binding subunit YedZ [Rhodospirillaceae bacterium]MBT5241545.1 sulfoxide reductase heme-binding subunit YedZ [Rhodospirillaceae bacterium]MBT5566185.1 sulfoxide reductase heme-binding subunit YedZ [Rhodospirillaceae bacterium]MBT6088903.1 sulfoxide reductase heme-binding subunit YedZ [Rhodospirillaceae bacterium]MBT7449878.1 sulfoxide reductase heme-binding subunit YedZ [Rhodospirillaceae bacterium]
MTDTTQNAGATEPRSKTKRTRWLKPVVFLLCLVPIFWLIARALTGGLGANPIEAITRDLGDWALRFILIALAVTPIRVLTGWNTIGRLRRMLGLFAFFYVILHFSSYIGLDQFFYWSGIWQDIVKRVYITLGMAAVLMLTPLAVTSTDKMIKRLGGRKWRRLHRLVYPAAVLGVIHFYMMLKADYTEPAIYAVILACFFGVRIYKKWA